MPDTKRGAHVGKANAGDVGICYIGGTDVHGQPKDTCPPAQKAALRRVIERYRALHPDIVIRGHRDWPGVAKACPSFDVASWIKAGMPA